MINISVATNGHFGKLISALTVPLEK